MTFVIGGNTYDILDTPGSTHKGTVKYTKVDIFQTLTFGFTTLMNENHLKVTRDYYCNEYISNIYHTIVSGSIWYGQDGTKVVFFL